MDEPCILIIANIYSFLCLSYLFWPHYKLSTLLVILMLLSVQNPFSPSRPRNKETLRVYTPLSGIISPFQTYTKAIELNLRKLKEKYPHREPAQLKEMLQELENDLEMTSALIQEEDSAASATKSQKCSQETPPSAPKVDKSEHQQKLDSLYAENKLLKRAFSKLLFKYQVAKEKVERQEEEIHGASIQINRLKTTTQLLLEEKFKQNAQELSNLYIC